MKDADLEDDAPPEENKQIGLTPNDLQYKIHLNNDVVFFDENGTGFLEISLVIGHGAPLELGGGDEPILIGARLFENTAQEGEEPVRGATLGEYRVNMEPMTATKARSYAFGLMVNLPAEATGRVFLEIGLVKELCFWLSDLGHECLRFPIERPAMISRIKGTQPADMARVKRMEMERHRREERYEAMIFSLINHLKRSS